MDHSTPLTEAGHWARRRIEQLEAENEQLKTVPMRYRRLAFNAKLQDENDELRNRVEQLEAENKELRRKLARMNEMLNDVLDAWAWP